jgi:hypothetical protein
MKVIHPDQITGIILSSCLAFSCPSIVGQENVRQENKAKSRALDGRRILETIH